MFNKYTNSHISSFIFLFLYGCYADVAECASEIGKELFFFYLSSQCHLKLLIHFLLASHTLCLELLLPSCVASPVLYMLLAPEGVHHHMLMPVSHVWLYTLLCLLMTFMFILIPSISWSLFSLCLLWNSQSMMYKSGQAVHNMHAMYWCIPSMMHCNCCNSTAISLLCITTNGQ